MIEQPLKCPNCGQMISDIKIGNFSIRNSTELDETVYAAMIRQCNRCKTKFIIECK